MGCWAAQRCEEGTCQPRWFSLSFSEVCQAGTSEPNSLALEPCGRRTDPGAGKEVRALGQNLLDTAVAWRGGELDLLAACMLVLGYQPDKLIHIEMSGDGSHLKSSVILKE